MHPLGIEGWRFVFLTVALVSITIGVATFFLSHDPRFGSDVQVSVTFFTGLLLFKRTARPLVLAGCTMSNGTRT